MAQVALNHGRRGVGSTAGQLLDNLLVNLFVSVIRSSFHGKALPGKILRDVQASQELHGEVSSLAHPGATTPLQAGGFPTRLLQGLAATL